MADTTMTREQLLLVHSKRIETSFGFCTKAYRPDYFWFEPVDMFRKLILAGLLQFFHRGTATQVLAGCTLTFAAFGLQQRLQPYRSNDANALKTLVEAQLFMTFLISFILRVLPHMASFESVDATVYALILVVSLVGVLAIALVLLGARLYQKSQHSQVNQSKGSIAGALLSSQAHSGSGLVEGINPVIATTGSQ